MYFLGIEPNEHQIPHFQGKYSYHIYIYLIHHILRCAIEKCAQVVRRNIHQPLSNSRARGPANVRGNDYIFCSKKRVIRRRWLH